MNCKDCSYFEGGFCSNQDTIVDPDDRICIGYKPKGFKCKDCKYFDGIDHCFYLYEATPLEECFACIDYEKEEEEES